MSKSSSQRKAEARQQAAAKSQSTTAGQITISGFIDQTYTAASFKKMLDSDLDIGLDRKTVGKRDVPWDLRVLYNAPKPYGNNSEKVKPPSWYISFGKLFTSAEIIHQRLLVGVKTSVVPSELILMFDTDHTRFKASPNNVRIKTEANGKAMKDMHSNPIGKKITDFFGIKLPTKGGAQLPLYFKLHQVPINGLKGANYYLELTNPQNESQ